MHKMSLKENIILTHRRFLKEALLSTQINSSKLSVIPSLLFVTFSFPLLYMIMHRRTSHLTKFRTKLCRDLGFHWTYFYILRIWLLIVKGTKVALGLLEDHLQLHFVESESYVVNQTFLEGVAFSFLLCLSMIPMVFLILRVFYRENIPNFLMWVGEDPWLRTEIGIAGHYLDRPIRLAFNKKMTRAYRARRSTSVEPICERSYVDATSLRSSKSMEHCSDLRKADMF